MITIGMDEYEYLLQLALTAIRFVEQGAVVGNQAVYINWDAEAWTSERAKRGMPDLRGEA